MLIVQVALNEKDFKMHLEEKGLTKDVNEVLFRDRYGILQLAANATVTRHPKPSPLNWFVLKEWVSSMFHKNLNIQ